MSIYTIVIIIILVSIHLYIRYLESSSVFYPSDVVWPSPQEVSLEFEDVNIKAADGVELHGWFIDNPQADKVFLFFHGNARSIHELTDRIEFLYSCGLSVMIFDYRGYGMSKGKPSEAGVYADSLAFYNYLLKERSYSADKIIAYGLSLGGAIAIDLAYHHELSSIILEGTFSSVRDMGKYLYPWAPRFLIKQRFDSFSKVRTFTLPVLMFHSRNDKTVPYKFAGKLFENITSEFKRFVMLEGDHPTAAIDEAQRCRKEIKLFVERKD